MTVCGVVAAWAVPVSAGRLAAAAITARDTAAPMTMRSEGRMRVICRLLRVEGDESGGIGPGAPRGRAGPDGGGGVWGGAGGGRPRGRGPPPRGDPLVVRIPGAL